MCGGGGGGDGHNSQRSKDFLVTKSKYFLAKHVTKHFRGRTEYFMLLMH